jgi:hypothetical protein
MCFAREFVEDLADANGVIGYQSMYNQFGSDCATHYI